MTTKSCCKIEINESHNWSWQKRDKTGQEPRQILKVSWLVSFNFKVTQWNYHHCVFFQLQNEICENIWQSYLHEFGVLYYWSVSFFFLYIKFIAPLFIDYQNLKTSAMSFNRRTDKLWSIYTMEYNTSENEMLSDHKKTWRTSQVFLN